MRACVKLILSLLAIGAFAQCPPGFKLQPDATCAVTCQGATYCASNCTVCQFCSNHTVCFGQNRSDCPHDGSATAPCGNCLPFYTTPPTPNATGCIALCTESDPNCTTANRFPCVSPLDRGLCGNCLPGFTGLDAPQPANQTCTPINASNPPTSTIIIVNLTLDYNCSLALNNASFIAQLQADLCASINPPPNCSQIQIGNITCGSTHIIIIFGPPSDPSGPSARMLFLTINDQLQDPNSPLRQGLLTRFAPPQDLEDSVGFVELTAVQCPNQEGVYAQTLAQCSTHCDAGDFINNNWKCSECAAGTYSDTQDSTSCKACPSGTDSDVGASTCIAITTCNVSFVLSNPLNLLKLWHADFQLTWSVSSNVFPYTSTGNVQFMCGTTILGEVTIDSSGEAGLDIDTTLLLHPISVEYEGDTHYHACNRNAVVPGRLL